MVYPFSIPVWFLTSHQFEYHVTVRMHVNLIFVYRTRKRLMVIVIISFVIHSAELAF
jgi:hypothetical protein